MRPGEQGLEGSEEIVSRAPFVWSFRRPSLSFVWRFFAHLIIRLLVITPLPPHFQAAAVLFPVSMLWPFVRPAAPPHAEPEASPEGDSGSSGAGLLPLSGSARGICAGGTEDRLRPTNILAGRESVRGTTGGSVPVTVTDGDSRLVIPANALGQDVAIELHQEALSPYLPAHQALLALGEVTVGFSGRTLLIPAELSIRAVGGVVEGDTLVLAKVERIEGVPKLTVVSLAQLLGDRVVTRTGGGLPGVIEGGRYVFYRTSPLGFVTGTTSTANGPVRAVVTTDTLPFIALAGANGHYLVAALPGPVHVSALVPRTTLAGSGQAVVNATETAPLDITLTGTATTATVTPADGSLGIPTSVQIEIEATAPLKPQTVLPTNILLKKDLDGTEVPTRLSLSGSRKVIGIVPENALEYSTTYRLEVSGLLDTYDGAVNVPVTRFTTKDNVAPVYNVDAIVFSFPDANGMVTVSAPPGTLPPGTTILIINEGNGVVVSFMAGNDGAFTGDLPASISDRLMVTVTDPNGNITTFQRSQYVAPDGTTGIGPGGGKVQGTGGTELRIPDGAITRGVTLKVTGLSADELSALFPNQAPDLPGAHMGSGIKIESPDKPTFKKEVDLAFPVPDFTTVPEGDRPPSPTDAWFYVYQRLTMPDGRAVFQVVDHAFVEGEAPNQKVVTASYPMEGYTGMYGSVNAQGVVTPASSAWVYLAWTFDPLSVGRPLPGAITGKVMRTVWNPGSTMPEYRPIENGLVSGVDATGQPLFANQANATVARTAADGRFVLFDPRYAGGEVEVAAKVADVVKKATALEANPADWSSTGLRFYRAVASVNITYPPETAQPPAPAVEIQVMKRSADGTLQDIEGLTVVDTALVIGFRARTDDGNLLHISTVEIQDRPYSVIRLTNDPDGFDYRLDGEFRPSQVGTYRIRLVAVSPFGDPLQATSSFRVISAGGDVSPDPLSAPQVRYVGPRDGSRGIAVQVFPEVRFSEPVKNVPGNVELLELDKDGAVVGPVGVSILGVGPAGPFENPGPETVATSLTLQPLLGLKYSTRYRLSLTSAIVDLDEGAPDDPKELPAFTSEFVTFGPAEPGGTGETYGSPGIVVLHDRAYLIENTFYQGVLKAYDVSDPMEPVEIQSARNYVTGRPMDVAGEEETRVTNGRLVVGATTSTNQPRPSNVYVFDASNDAKTNWVGLVSLTSSAMEGSVMRTAVKGGWLYAATYNKGIQTADLLTVKNAFVPCCSMQYWDMVRASNTDGQGFGQENVVSIPVTSGGQAARLWDLEVEDYLRSGELTRYVMASGDPPLVVVNPATQAVPYQSGALEVRESGTLVAVLQRGEALGLGRVGEQDLAVVAGSGRVLDAGASLAVVLGLTDPIHPEVLGYVELPLGATDVVVKGDMVLVGHQASVSIVSIREPQRPQLMGTVSGVGGRLAVGTGDMLFSTARSVFGGQNPLGGIRTLALGETGVIRLFGPNPFGVDAGGHSRDAVEARFSVIPPDKEVRTKVVELLRNGAVQEEVPVTAEAGGWKARFEKGKVFDPDSEYHLRFTVNRGDPDATESPLKRLRPALLEFTGTEEAAGNENLDLVRLFNPTPKLSLRAISSPGPGRRVTVTVIGDVESDVSPISKAEVSGQVVSVSQTSSGTGGLGPFRGTFTAEVSVGPQDTMVLAHAMNALQNLATASAIVTPVRDPSGEIIGRASTPRLEVSSQAEDASTRAFTIELKDLGQRGDEVRIPVDTGVETKQVVLTRQGNRFVSGPLYVVPENLSFEESVPQAVKDRVFKGRLGRKLELLYAENVKEDAALVGALLVDATNERPLDMVEPSDGGGTPKAVKLVLGRSGTGGPEQTVSLVSLREDLGPGAPASPAPATQQVRLTRQSEDPKAAGFNLYVSTEPVLAVHPQESVDLPGVREHGVVPGAYLKLDGDQAASVEPVGIPARKAEWLVRELRPVYEAGQSEPRFFDMIVLAKVDSWQRALPKVAFEAAFEMASDVTGEYVSVTPVSPVAGDEYQDVPFPGVTADDGRIYLRIRMSKAAASQLGSAQRLKGLTVRTLDAAGGTALDLLKGIATGEVPPGVEAALRKSGMAPLVTQFNKAGKAWAGLSRGMEELAGRIIEEAFEEVVKTAPGFETVRQAFVENYALAGITLTPEQSEEITVAFFTGIGLSFPLGFGQAALDDVNVISNAKGLIDLAVFGYQGTVILEKVRFAVTAGFIQFHLDPAYRTELLQRFEALGSVMVVLARIASETHVLQSFRDTVVKALYTNYEEAIGKYLDYVSYLREADRRMMFLVGFMLGHVGGYLTEIVGTLILGSLTAGIAAYVGTSMKLSRVQGILGKAVRFVGKLRVLPYRQAGKLERVGKIFLDVFLFLGDLDEPRFTKLLNELADDAPKAERALVWVDGMTDLAQDGADGQRLVPALRRAAAAFNQIDEPAETVAALGRFAERKVQTPDGERSLVFGLRCAFAIPGVPMAAAAASALPCDVEFENAIKGMGNVVKAQKQKPTLRVLDTIFDGFSDTGAVDRALAKLQGEDAGLINGTDDLFTALFHSFLSNSAWDVASFDALERLIARFTTTVPPPPNVNDAVMDIVTMIAKYGRKLGNDGPAATARIMKQLDRFQDATGNPVRNDQLAAVVRHLLALDKNYAAEGTTFAGLNRVDLDWLARNMERENGLTVNEIEIVNSFTRVTALKDEIDEVDMVTGPNSRLFRALQAYSQNGGSIPWPLTAKTKGSLGNMKVAWQVRPHGRTDTDVLTQLPDPDTGYLKWIDAILTVDQPMTFQVWGLQNGQAVLETVTLLPGQQVPFEVKAFALSTWTQTRINNTLSEVRAGLRQVDIAAAGTQPSILAVTNDLAQDPNRLATVLQAINNGLPLQYQGRAKIWVLDKSASQLGQEADALIQRLVP